MALFIGTPDDDSITGTNSKDYAYGFTGNDSIWGLRGSDNLRGSEGNDFIDGGLGADGLGGDDGNDNLYGGDDASRDILIGYTGNDTLNGGPGSDTLAGGLNADILIGDLGADYFVYDSASESTRFARDRIEDFSREQGDKIDLSSVFTGSGVDFVFIGEDTYTGLGQVRVKYTEDGHTLVKANTSAATGSELVIDLVGTIPLTADDFIFSNGNQFANVRHDVLTGGEGDDFLAGGGGDDYVFGDIGNDEVRGGAGIDIVRGGFGDDLVIGGKGDDFLYGGEERDTFVFNGAFGRDLVQDFHPEDTLQFGPSPTGEPRSMASLTITQQGSDVIINDGLGNQVVLGGYLASSLNAGDFIFA
jgi:Ca2+-binding RTX toxin-like protein